MAASSAALQENMRVDDSGCTAAELAMPPPHRRGLMDKPVGDRTPSELSYIGFAKAKVGEEPTRRLDELAGKPGALFL